MIHHVWTVLCSRSVIDVESNNVSIQNCIEQLTIPGSPKSDGKIAIPLELVSFWTRVEPDKCVEGEAKITFLQPSGEEIELIVYPIDLDESNRVRVRVKIDLIPIPEEGLYQFCIEFRLLDTETWHRAGQIPLEIAFQSEEDE